MKELLGKFPAENDILSLTDRQLDSALLEIVTARANSDGLTLPKFLSQGELENVYGVSLSLPADRVKQIDESLMAAYQRLLSGNFTMPAPGQPAGVVTVTPKGRLGLPPEANVKIKPLIEWAGGSRVTLAIVFTDIVGSTALGVELGDAAMGEVRRKHFAQSTTLIAKQAGREIKTIGDSVMAVFRSVEAALDYVCALQLNPGSSELRVRAGIHIGSVDVVADDVFGTEVALARRVVDTIEGAEIWLSNRAKEDLDRAGAHRQRGLRWQVYNVELKGIGAERLWSLVLKPSATELVEPASTQSAVVASAPKFKEAKYKDGEARFRSAGEPIGVNEYGSPIFLPPGVAMWLRVMPATETGKTWKPYELKKHVFQSRTSDLTPFAFTFVSTAHDVHFLRARDGFGVYYAVATSGTTSVAFGFRTGEIWSIDTGVLASCPSELPAPLIETAYNTHLHGYASFLQHLGIDPPYRWIAGLAGVSGRRLEIPNRSFPGPLCLAELITDEGMYDLKQEPAAVLRPFFESIFDECDVPRQGFP